ncbi:MAG: hypothetical protein A3E01_08380 [Gammaproteobacteria bacterium RIFCSPHIGHO2_12_FULL_63_22]|nr:MAG: hypothetical protein A3E01_08380 [Gammaproteobacteria bacterium RIFCSPHIGHO2_12_FULL_63_22]
MSGMRYPSVADLPARFREQAERQIRTVRSGKNPAQAKPVQVAPERPPVNKYNATRIRGSHNIFGSKHEYHCYREAKLRERAGEIKDLRVHVKFSLFDPGGTCKGEHIGTYTSDLVWKEQGKLVVADAKSPATRSRRDWARTKKILRACHGIEVLEL